MKESNIQSFCTFSRRFVDQTNAVCISFSQRICYSVFYCKSHMMNSHASVFNKFGNCAIRSRRLQQFNFCFTTFQESSFYFLIFCKCFMPSSKRLRKASTSSGVLSAQKDTRMAVSMASGSLPMAASVWLG